MAFHPVVPPANNRSQLYQRPRKIQVALSFLRGQLSVSSWLLVGALLQSVVVLFVPRLYVLIPLVLVLGTRLLDTLAVTWGFKRNHYLDHAILHRTSPQIPDENGDYHDDKTSNEKVTVFILGAKFNHPLGLFSHNAGIVGDSLQRMLKELDQGAEDKDKNTDNGFYGATSWTRQAENNAMQTMNLSYWRSPDDIHRYAYGPLHRQTWEWWNRTLAENAHIGIMHEIYQVDRRQWEGVYINFQPTLLGATSYLKRGDTMVGGRVDDRWISALVDARRGRLRSSAGRLGREPDELYEKYQKPLLVDGDVDGDVG